MALHVRFEKSSQGSSFFGRACFGGERTPIDGECGLEAGSAVTQVNTMKRALRLKETFLLNGRNFQTQQGEGRMTSSTLRGLTTSYAFNCRIVKPSMSIRRRNRTSLKKGLGLIKLR